MSMQVIPATHLANDLDAVSRAWRERDTFLYYSPRSGLSDTWLKDTLAHIPADVHHKHFALLTSGSTGQPRLVMGSRDRAEALARTLHDVQQSEPVRETILALPPHYCFAFVNQWLWAHVHGRTLQITPGLADASAFVAALEQADDAMLCLVGAQVPLLLQAAAGRSFSGVIRLHFAGGRFPQQALPQLAELFPRALVMNNYGCAEAMPRLTLRTATASDEAAHIGWTLPGVEMRTDESSLLAFRSPFGAVGLGDDCGFAMVDTTEWLPTGDLGEQLDDGAWRLLGRAGEVFKRYGEKVALPSILERVAPVCTGRLAAYRERDAAGEEGYVLVVSPPPDKGIMPILAVFREAFPRALWPLRVEGLPVLPLLPNGKLDMTALPGHEGALELWRQRI
jgi:acyl-CoA synthetase (AMP-forming)/AMP-acid ligase II